MFCRSKHKKDCEINIFMKNHEKVLSFLKIVCYNVHKAAEKDRELL